MCLSPRSESFGEPLRHVHPSIGTEGISRIFTIASTAGRHTSSIVDLTHLSMISTVPSKDDQHLCQRAPINLSNLLIDNRIVINDRACGDMGLPVPLP